MSASALRGGAPSRRPPRVTGAGNPDGVTSRGPLLHMRYSSGVLTCAEPLFTRVRPQRSRAFEAGCRKFESYRVCQYLRGSA